MTPLNALRISLAAALVGTLAACGPPATRYSEGFERQVREVGNPSTLVARELAYARAVREDGQASAMRRFAVEGAIVHGADGPVPLSTFLSRAAGDPGFARQWTPTAVYLSCDGSMAVTRGKYRDGRGIWGYYATVWERGKDWEYRTLYELSGADAELTERENRAARPSVEADGVIVVEGVDTIRGIVADCAAAGVPVPPAPIPALPEGSRAGGGFAADRTLQWLWTQLPDGRRSLAVGHLQGGTWTKAFELGFPASGNP